MRQCVSCWRQRLWKEHVSALSQFHGESDFGIDWQLDTAPSPIEVLPAKVLGKPIGANPDERRYPEGELCAVRERVGMVFHLYTLIEIAQYTERSCLGGEREIQSKLEGDEVSILLKRFRFGANGDGEDFDFIYFTGGRLWWKSDYQWPVRPTIDGIGRKAARGDEETVPTWYTSAASIDSDTC